MGRLAVPALIEGATLSPGATLPARELTYDPIGRNLAIHDGQTPGGISLTQFKEDAAEARDRLILDKLADYLPTPLDFGAKMDAVPGVYLSGTDDTAALQRTIDAVGVSGFQFPRGRLMRVMQPISVPGSDTARLVMQGTGGFDNIDASGGGIACYAPTLFVSQRAGNGPMPKLRLEMRGMTFFDMTNGGAGGTATLFEGYEILMGRIYDNYAHNFRRVFHSVLGNCTRMLFNRFDGVTGAVVAASDFYGTSGQRIAGIVDCNIAYNYLNGGGVAGTKAIDSFFTAASIFDTNFIDFFEHGLFLVGGGDVTVHHNIFDYCYRGAYISQINNVTFSNNRGGHLNRTHIDRFPGAAGATKIGGWALLETGFELDNMLIADNSGDIETEQLIMFGVPDPIAGRMGVPASVMSDLRNIRTRGNSIRGNYDPQRVVAWQRFHSANNDGRGVRIEEMLNRRVALLPDPKIAYGGTFTFDGDEVIQDGRRFFNDDGEWKLPDGHRRFPADGSNLPAMGGEERFLVRQGDVIENKEPAPGKPTAWAVTVGGTGGYAGYPDRAPNTEYLSRQRFKANGNLYAVASKGTTAAGAGPTGTGTGIADGTAIVDYLGPAGAPTFVAVATLP